MADTWRIRGSKVAQEYRDGGRWLIEASGCLAHSYAPVEKAVKNHVFVSMRWPQPVAGRASLDSDGRMKQISEISISRRKVK